MGGGPMGRIGSPEHEEKLKEFAAELEKDGYRVILLHGKSPDGIAIKDGEVCAVEVIAKRLTRVGQYKGKYYERGTPKYRWKTDGVSFAQKRLIYSMFDDVLFAVHYKEETDKRKLTSIEKEQSEKYKKPFIHKKE